jgi:site-specific recombinase XerD
MFRNLLREFAVKVLKIPAATVDTSPLLHQHTGQEGELLLQARILAYSTSTWIGHASAIQVFVQFCANREIDIFQCTPYSLNLFLLHIAQQGKSFGSVQRFLAAYSFILRFFGHRDIVSDPSVYELKKFLAKVCPHVANKKQPFGSAEVRALWDSVEANGGIEKLSKLELRTFVMVVTQHATFCRFSDLQHVKLTDILFELDYFKINIQYSKTDQAGIGQYVYVPKNQSNRDAHMLLCLYLSDLDSDVDDMYLFPPLM